MKKVLALCDAGGLIGCVALLAWVSISPSTFCDGEISFWGFLVLFMTNLAFNYV